MNLDLVNRFFNSAKKSDTVENLINELQNYLKQNSSNTIKKEDITLCNFIGNENKIITIYRDKMLIERANILHEYAKQTLDKGGMYYIYSKNSVMEEVYNLCDCEEGKSNNVIEVKSNDLPNGAKVGDILRKIGDSYILDEETTNEITEEINYMKDKLLEEQKVFLESKRIEGHIYEIYENNVDRAWLFDITSDSSEEIEEIDFPEELLKDAKEGDLFIYKDGEYQKY